MKNFRIIPGSGDYYFPKQAISRQQYSFYILFFFFFLLSCGNQDFSPFTMDNVFAWCIVPFDSEERSPSERMEMLQELGFRSYAYDWREKHLDELSTEITLAKTNHIEISAVWMWLDVRNDSVGHLSASNQKLLDILKETELKTTIWVSFNANYFKGLDQQAAVQKGVEIIGYISQRAATIGCKLALYNHGEWFGEPGNQIEIIKALPQHDLGVIYNFHHAHLQLEEFPKMVKVMTPYLWAVNLNGVKVGGPKILTIGQGDRETEMINLLRAEGFNGPWGVLGHIETEDVKVVLERNLKGLQALNLD